MSIQSEIDRLKTAKSGLATAITGKGVTVPEDATLSDYPALVDQIQTGGGGGEPEPPDDGKTRLYIHVPENAKEGLPPPRADVPLYISQTVSDGVTIDWGDDSEPETISGTGNVNTAHYYAAGGDYVIALTVTDGCELGFGWNSSDYCVMGSTSNHNYVYCNMLQKVVTGNGVTSIGSSAFQNCYSLASVVIPDSVTSIGSFAFYYCYSLASVVIPDSVTSIGSFAFFYCYSLASVVIPDSVTSIGISAFYYCYSLASVVIPDSVTSIGSFAFYYCYSLASVVIPDSVTSIGRSAFYCCYGVKEYHILVITPPTIQSNTFNDIPSDCIIYVPAGTVDAYKTATNWAELADHIQEEPA